jgi:hypothetical protein
LFKKQQPAFRLVAAVIFALVALAHAARLAWAVPITIGEQSIPLSVSWVGLILAGMLSLWGFANRL